MLESELNTNVLALCLKNPEDAPAIVKSMKTDIIKSDFEVLVSSAAIHPSAKYVAIVAETTSWCRLWDIALDRGVQAGTRGMQSLLKELNRQVFENFSCRSYGTSLSKDSLWFNHICTNMNNLPFEEIISGLSEADVDIIFSIANSTFFLRHLSCVLPPSFHYIMYFIILYHALHSLCLFVCQCPMGCVI